MNEIPKAQGAKTAGMASFIRSQDPPVALFRINRVSHAAMRWSGKRVV